MKTEAFLISVLCLIGGITGCRHTIVDPGPNPISDSLSNPALSGDFVLCYMSPVSGNWNVVISGSNAQNVSVETNLPSGQYDQYPSWSPDGNHILFERSASAGGPSVHVFDLTKKTDTVVTSDGGVTLLPPQWTSNGKICCVYERPIGSDWCTYLMNADGSGNTELLDFAASVYFYQNNYDFVYSSYNESSRWHKTNLDHSVNLTIVDSLTSINQYITVRDFNSATGEFLVNTNTLSGVLSAIATLNAETKQLVPLLMSPDSTTYALQRYSPDHTKIVFVEMNGLDQYLSVLENGTKRRLVHIAPTHPPVYFASDPFQFSSDGRYVAFAEMAFQSGQWVSYTEHVYVVDIVTRGLQQIGEGTAPSWKP